MTDTRCYGPIGWATAFALLAAASAHAATILEVNYGLSPVPSQSGFTGLSGNSGDLSDSWSNIAGTGINATLSTNQSDGLGYRDRGTTVTGTFASLSNLLNSEAKSQNSNTGTGDILTLTLTGLTAGSYEILTYHQGTTDVAPDPGSFNEYLDVNNTGVNTGSSNYTLLNGTPIVQTLGTNPSSIATTDVVFTIASGNALNLQFRLVGDGSDATQEVVLNGFVLSTVPEPSTLALLALGACAVSVFAMRRQRVLRCSAAVAGIRPIPFEFGNRRIVGSKMNVLRRLKGRRFAILAVVVMCAGGFAARLPAGEILGVNFGDSSGTIGTISGYTNLGGTSGNLSQTWSNVSWNSQPTGIDVTVSTNFANGLGFRDRGTTITGAYAAQQNLINSQTSSQNNATSGTMTNDILTLALTGLAAGTYQITSDHHDSQASVSPGSFNVLVDVTDTNNYTQVNASPIVATYGGSPSSVGAETFTFTALAGTPVNIEYALVSGSQLADYVPLNGFTLVALAPEPGSAALMLFGLAGGASVASRRRGGNKVA